jgi:hypothetical protein
LKKEIESQLDEDPGAEKASAVVEQEFEIAALIPEIQRRLVRLDIEGAIALTDGVSAQGGIFLSGFSEGFLAGMNVVARHQERLQ